MKLEPFPSLDKLCERGDRLIIEKTEDTVTVRTVMHPDMAFKVACPSEKLPVAAPGLGRAAFFNDHEDEMDIIFARLLASTGFLRSEARIHDFWAVTVMEEYLWGLQEDYAQEAVRKLAKE